MCISLIVDKEKQEGSCFQNHSKWQLANVKDVLMLENHHFATIIKNIKLTMNAKYQGKILMIYRIFTWYQGGDYTMKKFIR